MNPNRDTAPSLQQWLNLCLPQDLVTLDTLRNLKKGLEREVWECQFHKGADLYETVLVIFKPGGLETVNTSLPPNLAAEKCALAISELPGLGIPTPVLIGYATMGGETAVLSQKASQTEWAADKRLLAARTLARLHTLAESKLSPRLQELARLSDPREFRTTRGEAPQSQRRTLVHGDYFRANILPVAEGIQIIDWETLGWGDPMWDLGFLIGAERGLAGDEVETIIAAYESANGTVDQPVLAWHRSRWAEFWNKRDSR